MISEIAVVVPARDENDALPICLQALQEAAYRLQAIRPFIRLSLILALSGQTTDLQSTLDGFHAISALPVFARTAGGARAAGVTHAIGTISALPARVWLANTDADSQVPSDWLVEMIRHAESGAHVVLGTVVPDDQLEEHLRKRWDDQHTLVEGHPHVHGANFGIRADVYLRLGG